jgi:hypothetical protein
MNVLLKIVALFFAASLATAYAQSNAPNKETSTKTQLTIQENVDALIKSLAQNKKVKLFSGDPQNCDIANDKGPCPVKLTVQPLFDADNNLIACAASIGELTIDFGLSPSVNKSAVIHWTISAGPGTPSSATYGFDATYGLIVLQDNDKATNGKKDNSSTTTDLYMTYKFKRHPTGPNKQTVIYYPLVFQSVVGSPAPTLCASTDPQIANN